MYGGSGTSPVRLAVDAHAPAPLAEVLEQLDGAVAPARPQPPRRPRERLPDVAVEPLEQQDFPFRPLDRDSGREARACRSRPRASPARARRRARRRRGGAPRRSPVEDEQPRCVPALGRMLGDQLRGKLVVEVGGSHPIRALLSRHGRSRRAREESGWPTPPPAASIRRPSTRRSSAPARRWQGSPRPRTRSNRRFRSRSKKRSASGCGSSFRPSARHLAEVRGLMNQVIRRLERIEGDAPRRAPRARSTTWRCSSTSSRPAGSR